MTRRATTSGPPPRTGTVTQTLTLGEAFAVGPDGVRTDEALSAWVRGQLARYTQEIDGKVVDGNRNLLFGLGATVDLEVFDIQRGRDHGVGRYNKLRDGLGFDEYASFEDFAAENGVDAATLAALKNVYDDDIDAARLDRRRAAGEEGERLAARRDLHPAQRHAVRGAARRGPAFLPEPLRGQPAAPRDDREHLARRTSWRARPASTTSIATASLAHERIGGTDGANGSQGTAKADLLIGFKGDDRAFGGGATTTSRRRGRTTGSRAASATTWRSAARGATGSRARTATTTSTGARTTTALYGGAGDDFVFGGSGKDKAYGGSGRDRLDGGAGDDWHSGGSGADVFAFGRYAGRDAVQDFGRSDKLDLSELGFATLKDVREATHKSHGATTIALDDHGAQVKLLGVGWSLTAANVILADDGAFA